LGEEEGPLNTQNKILAVIAVIMLVVVGVVATRNPDKEKGSSAKSKEKVAEKKSAKAVVTEDAGKTDDAGKHTASVKGPITSATATTAVATGPSPLPAGVTMTSGTVTFENEEALRAAIFGEDQTLREQAYLQLAKMLEKGEGKAVLEEMIQTGGEQFEEEVLALMPNVPEGERADMIAQCLDSTNPEFRLEALQSVRDVAGYDVSDLLIKGMKDDSPEVLEETGDLLFYFDDQPIYSAAIAGLSHSDEYIRDNAMGFLEDNHTGQSIRTLIQYGLTSNIPDLVTRAGDALRFITDAEIESNDPQAWQTWFDQNGAAWIAENDQTVPDTTPTPAPTPAAGN
jgi:hypothetical protein